MIARIRRRGRSLLGRPDSSRVVEVAELLWPVPNEVVISRRFRPGCSSREWLVLPGLRRPWLLLPASGGAVSSALERHDSGQRSRWAYVVAQWLHRHGLLSLLPLNRLRIVSPDADAETVEDPLRTMIGDFRHLVIRLGRSREGRHVVLRPVTDTGQTVAFVKLTDSDRGAAALHIEATNLERLRDLDPAGVCGPVLLGEHRWRGSALMAMTPMVGDGGGQRQEGIPTAAMRSLALASPGNPRPFAKTPFFARLEESIHGLPSSLRSQISGLVEAFDRRWGQLEVPIGCWHGDWVAWNMSVLGGDVQLWDWEHFAEGVPLGFDVLHFTAQTARATSGTGSGTEQGWLAEGPALAATVFDLTPEQVRPITVAYLLEVNARFLADRRDTPASAVRQGWGLPMVAGLLNEGGTS